MLSHGHGDHHGGLEGLLRSIGRRRLPLVLHPDAWKSRKLVFPSGEEVRLPPPDRRALTDAGVELIEQRTAFLLGGQALVSGVVPRVTPFEHGFPIQWAQGASGWEPDPMVWDDQSLMCLVRGRGLVVRTGCGHAGAIKIIENARQVTGEAKLHALIGGLHLSGRLFEPIIEPTVNELERHRVDYIVPGHCTGWRGRS